MRIADKMAFTQVNSSLAKNRLEMSELQNQAATQKRITKPSDDPLASTRVLAARTDERVQRQFIKSQNIARGFLEYTDQSMGELTDVLMRAKELALSQASDGASNEDSRKVVAEEVRQLMFQAVQIGNRKLGDRYIFAGARTTTAPFDSQGKYFGDAGDIKIQINKDTFLSMNIPGSKVFLGESLDGDGVSRAENDTPQSVKELQEYKQLQEEKAKEQKEAPELVPVLASSDKKRGIASASSKAEEGAKNDSTWKTKGVNLFDTLRGLHIALGSGDKAGVQDALDVIDESMAQVILARSQVGARVMALNNTTESIQKSIVDNRTVASQLEDADVFQVVSDINKTESALKATLETSGKLIQPSLLDFLR